jgi:hypothetical protein
MEDGRILALRWRHRPILAHSIHFLEIRMFRAVGVTFANATVDKS